MNINDRAIVIGIHPAIRNVRISVPMAPDASQSLASQALNPQPLPPRLSNVGVVAKTVMSLHGFRPDLDSPPDSAKLGQTIQKWRPPAAGLAKRIENTEAIELAHLTPEEQAVWRMRDAFIKQFGRMARNPEAFHQMMATAFGHYDVQGAENYRLAALRGDYSWLPPVSLAKEDFLRGYRGAYLPRPLDSRFPREAVYIDQRFMNDPSTANRLFIEAIGHKFEAELRLKPAQGKLEQDPSRDGGECFQMILAQEWTQSPIPYKEWERVMTEKEEGYLKFDGSSFTYYPAYFMM